MSAGEIGLRLLAATVVGYLIGSFPSGVLVGKFLGGGVDPRASGSGKTGATNVLRTLGPGPAACVVALDLSKGILSVLAARFLFFPASMPTSVEVIGPLGTTYQTIAESTAALGALLGHNYSIYIKFTGGRGVLTGAGTILVMQPIAWVAAFIAAVVPIAVTRYVSLGSILGATTAPVADLALVLTGHDALPHLLYITLGSTIVVVSHKDNIQRLLSGTERKLGEKAPAPAEKA